MIVSWPRLFDCYLSLSRGCFSAISRSVDPQPILFSRISAYSRPRLGRHLAIGARPTATHSTVHWPTLGHVSRISTFSALDRISTFSAPNVCFSAAFSLSWPSLGHLSVVVVLTRRWLSTVSLWPDVGCLSASSWSCFNCRPSFMCSSTTPNKL